MMRLSIDFSDFLNHFLQNCHLSLLNMYKTQCATPCNLHDVTHFSLQAQQMNTKPLRSCLFCPQSDSVICSQSIFLPNSPA